LFSTNSGIFYFIIIIAVDIPNIYFCGEFVTCFERSSRKEELNDYNRFAPNVMISARESRSALLIVALYNTHRSLV